ncbi:hypothetical protein C0Q70_03721 [Pomacea canaliculata]|uniref:Secreted protein n=1 Tax=Pomacea canaliculata TaxID=400727 RepID=A0A2T7PTH5_POMCA|nr:hypothetical protein C0Q70_03721 [Pomacea canaliculata]
MLLLYLLHLLRAAAGVVLAKEIRLDQKEMCEGVGRKGLNEGRNVFKRKSEVTPSPASAAIIRAHVHQLAGCVATECMRACRTSRDTRGHTKVCVSVYRWRACAQTYLRSLAQPAAARDHLTHLLRRVIHLRPRAKRDDPPPLPPQRAPVYVRVCRWMSRGGLGRGRYQSYLERWRLQERLGGRGEGKGRGHSGSATTAAIF